MIFLRQSMGLIMLAIASLGPAPLWLHHELSHAHCPDSAEKNGDCAGHYHSPTVLDPSIDRDYGEHRPSAPPQGEASPGAHDCWICFNLSQAPSVCLIGSLSDQALFVFDAASPGDVLFRAAVFCPHPPRGPPTV